MGMLDNTKGALPEVAKRIASVASDIVTVRTATVATDGVPPKETMVILDNDPSRTPIAALGLNFSLAQGTRVVCLAYPPRGMVVLGAIANASGGSTDELVLTCDDDTSLEIECDSIQALAAGVASALALNPGGGNVNLGASLVVAGATYSSGFVSFPESGQHLHMDHNQLYARTGAEALSPLHLNYLGGGVQIQQGAPVLAITQFGPDPDIRSASGHLRLNWQTGLPVALGGSGTTTLIQTHASVTSNLACGGTLTVGGDTTTSGRIDHVPPTGAASSTPTFVSAGGGVYRLRLVTSSLRYKRNVEDLDIEVAQILALRPRTYNRIDDWDPVTDEALPLTENSPRYPGFIAEEAEELGLIPWLTYNDEGLVDGFKYETFVVAQQAVLRAQDKRIAELEEKNAALEARLAAIEARLG